MPVRHQLSPLLECGCAVGIETSRSALRACWGPGNTLPQTPPHRQPWPLYLPSSVFRAERRAQKGRDSEGAQGGSGERVEALQKCELAGLIPEHTSERQSLTLTFLGRPMPPPQSVRFQLCCWEEVMAAPLANWLFFSGISPGGEQAQGQEATPAAVIEVHLSSLPRTYVYLNLSSHILNVATATGAVVNTNISCGFSNRDFITLSKNEKRERLLFALERRSSKK